MAACLTCGSELTEVCLTCRGRGTTFLGPKTCTTCHGKGGTCSSCKFVSAALELSVIVLRRLTLWLWPRYVPLLR